MNTKSNMHTKSHLNRFSEQLNSVYRTNNTPPTQACTFILCPPPLLSIAVAKIYTMHIVHSCILALLSTFIVDSSTPCKFHIFGIISTYSTSYTT